MVAEDIDFEAAEKAAKAEAERIEKLGYDPETERKEETTRSTSVSKPTIPDNVPVPSVNNTRVEKQGRERSASEVERLGMGVARLGFGQVGRPSGSTVAAPKKLGFGAVGAAKPAVVEGESIDCSRRVITALTYS